MAQFNLKLTTQGVLLLAKATAGKTLHFQAIVMGDGSYSGDPSAVQSVISPKKELEIYRVLRDGKKVSIRGVLGLNQIDTPFWWRELGLIAADPDTGESVLAAYGNAMEKADYIANGSVLDERVIDISLVIDESAEISADASGLIFAEEEAFQAHKADFSAHMIRLVHEKSGTTHALTGLTGVTGTVSCVFTASAAFAAGDTFTIDGTPYTIQLSNGESAEDNLFVTGAAVPLIVDVGAKKVNFKSGGGLSASKLALATAAAADVLSGKTFYAGDKEIKTGSLQKGLTRVSGSVTVDTDYTTMKKTVTLSGTVKTLIGTYSAWSQSPMYYCFFDKTINITRNPHNSGYPKLTVSGNTFTVDNSSGDSNYTLQYIAYCD